MLLEEFLKRAKEEKESKKVAKERIIKTLDQEKGQTRILKMQTDLEERNKREKERGTTKESDKAKEVRNALTRVLGKARQKTGVSKPEGSLDAVD